MKSITIIEFPSNLGLKEPQPGKEPGVKNLPDWLRKHHLHQILNPENTLRLEAPKYSNIKDKETQILNANLLIEYAVKQAEIVAEVLAKNQFPFILGGDCSILLGPAIALKQTGNFGLFYLDGHTDFMDASLSETGGVGGMAASIVIGNGPQKLTNILGLTPYIKEENLWCVGNREYDDEYENEIRKSTATYISLETLRKRGIQECTVSFLSQIESKNLDGFWLHIDVDVLNDLIMPCVDSRTPDGLTYNEFNQLALNLFKSDKLAGLEITILDPDLDETGEYTRVFVENLTTVFDNADCFCR